MNQLDRIINQVSNIMKLRKRSKAFRYLSSFMAGAVVFTTTYSLILPAITMEYETASEMNGIYLEDTADGIEGDAVEAEENAASISENDVRADVNGSVSEESYVALENNIGTLEDSAAKTEDNDFFAAENVAASEELPDGMSGLFLEDTGYEEHAEPFEHTDSASQQVILEEYEPALSSFSPNSRNAVSGNIMLRLDFADPVPEDEVLSFHPVETQHFNNYYNGAKNEISRMYPDWSDLGYTVTDGRFWNVALGTGVVNTKVTISILRNEEILVSGMNETGEEINGTGEALYMDTETVFDTADRLAIVDWSDDSWHVYDPDEVVVNRLEDGSVSEIRFETDALRDGAADFGILCLNQEDGAGISDGFAVSDLDGFVALNSDGFGASEADGFDILDSDGLHASDADGFGASEPEGFAISDTGSLDDSEHENNDGYVEGWITDSFDTVEDGAIEGWITDQSDADDDVYADGWSSDELNSVDESQTIGAAFDSADADDHGIVDGWITDQADEDETVIEEAAIEEDSATDLTDTDLFEEMEETESSADLQNIENYLLDEVNAVFETEESLESTESEENAEAVETSETAEATETADTEGNADENIEECETEAEAFEEVLEASKTETVTESSEESLTEIETELSTEGSEQSLTKIETETTTNLSEESLEEYETENITEASEENLEEYETENVTEASEENLEEFETGIETEPSEESLEEFETETETEAVEEFLEETEIETESVWEDFEELETETEEIIVYPAQSFAYEGEVSVFVTAPEGALPENTTMEVTPVEDDDDIANIAGAVTEENSEKTVRRIDAVDITFFDKDGMEIEPLIPVRVRMVTQQRQSDEDTLVVHLDDEGNAEKVENASIYQSGEETHYMFASLEKEKTEEEISDEYEVIGEQNDEMNDDGMDTESNYDSDEALQIAEFETEQFSIYAVVYTVDFHYEVDGKIYELRIPGGGFVSLEHLVEVLGIGVSDTDTEKDAKGAETSGESAPEKTETLVFEDDSEEQASEEKASAYDEAVKLNEVEVSEAAKKFVAEVENVEFSTPALVWIGKVFEAATVGGLKEANKLEIQYSADLTKKQIEELNAQTVEAGDWALISMQPFTSEEKLTVTMKDGQVFTIDVTDALHVDPSDLVGKEVVIFDKSENRALTSDWEQNKHRTQFGSVEYAGERNPTTDNAHWIVEGNGNSYYLKSHDNKYLKIDNSNVYLVNTQSEATPLTIQKGGNPDYRIYAQNDDSKLLTYSENNEYPGFFSAPGGTVGTGNTRTWLGIDYAVSFPDPVGDWLLYFDDDFDEITIHVGETITLRPYNKWEWKEGNVDVQTAHWNVGTWNDWSIASSDENGDKFDKSVDGPFEFTRYVKKDSQLTTHYWSVQGRATRTGDYILKNKKNDKTITVHVVDGAPVNQPKTINTIANIKVNLFDYDKNYLLDPTDNTNLANNKNNKNDSVNQMGGTDHFYFLSSGSGDNDSESWNSYTKDRSNPNIVKNELDSEGYPVLNHGKNTSLKYLFDTTQTNWHGGNNSDGMIAYPDVVGMFQKDPETGYYYFNSNTNYFYYDTATGTSKLYEHTYTQTSGETKGSLVNDKPIGFFPFHDYDATSNLYVNQNHNLNHHVGLSMEVEFMLPKDRKDDNGKDIIFDFSGDDDLWVFVEWVDDNNVKHSKRMLDLGGVHQPIHGQINFTQDTSILTNRPYTLKVFYLERGGCDSNCSIRFNLPIIQDLTVAKKLTGLTEAEKAKYKDEEFTYEIVVNNQPYNYPNPNNRYEKAVLRNAAGEDITPANFTISNGRVKIKDGQTLTITYLDRSDKFSVAEVKTPNMENFEVPHAERYFHQKHDASLYEEEIALTASHMQAEPHTDDWVTPTYELEDTEKVTFTNTLKEKNLEVEKKWNGNKEHPDSITFTVSATVDDGTGKRVPYAVSGLKNADGTTDKVFTLSDSNNWRYEIEHLPVNTPDGKLIFYDIKEGHVEGYTLTGVRDLTAENYNYCDVDVVKLWPDSNGEHTEVLEVVLKNSAGKYYAGTNVAGEAFFVDNISEAVSFSLTKDNNYTHRFERVPAGEYTAEQLHEDAHAKGLATYVRNIIQYQLENSPVNGPVNPEDQPNTPEVHKRIDALRDGAANPDSPHTGEDLTDLYRLYLDYKIKSLQEASGVDLLFVIDHSGSMNNTAWQGNPYRAPAVEDALNGNDGLISEFLNMNEKNQWAAVGFKGPDGAENYYWWFGNPWQPATALAKYNAGLNGSEVLSPGGEDYVFTRTNNSTGNNVTLKNDGADILTNYTAGLWRAEQFLLKQNVKEDGRNKVIVFISDGIPTLHIDCPGKTLQEAGNANGSPYYRDAYGGCPTQTLTEFGYFVNDMTNNGYTFGENVEFYTIGFGGTMQTENGSQLLNDMLDIAYGEKEHTNHFMTISDTTYDPWSQSSIDYSAATESLKSDLRKIMGMNEKFSNIVIEDDLSAYVDLYGLAAAGSNAADIMRAAKAKVTMSLPDPNNAGRMQTITLYENGAPAAGEEAIFTKANGQKASIIQELRYNSSTKTVQAVFDPEYQAVAGAVYTLSFDVKATDEAYTKYAASGYDKYLEGEKQGQTITGDPDTDFLGTDPDNATSVNKEGFRSNDGAKVTYIHNGKNEEKEYPHPVIQVAARADIVKTDQTGTALEGAKFNLYSDRYDAGKTLEENAGCLIEADLQSKKTAGQAEGDAVIRNGKLTAGTYYLVETKAPDGYNSLPGPVKITVTETNGVLNMSAEIAGVTVGDKLVKTSEYGVWKLKIQNSAGYELPSTGGSGTAWIYLLGIILSGFAGAGLVMRKRRRKAV